jgi:hypothetical protein
VVPSLTVSLCGVGDNLLPAATAPIPGSWEVMLCSGGKGVRIGVGGAPWLVAAWRVAEDLSKDLVAVRRHQASLVDGRHCGSLELAFHHIQLDLV